MVTSVLFQPLPFAAVRTAVMRGRSLSMLTMTVTAAVLPALSWVVPVTAWSAPSLVRVTGAGQESMPERASAQAKFTVTSALFQPSPLGAWVRFAVMVGGRLSMLSIVAVV